MVSEMTEEGFWTRDDSRPFYGALLVAGLLSGGVGFGGLNYFERKANEVRGRNQNLQELLSAREEISQQRGLTIDVRKVETLQKKIHDLEYHPEIKADLGQYGKYMDIGAGFLIVGAAFCGGCVLTGIPGLLHSFPYRQRDNLIKNG